MPTESKQYDINPVKVKQRYNHIWVAGVDNRSDIRANEHSPSPYRKLNGLELDFEGIIQGDRVGNGQGYMWKGCERVVDWNSVVKDDVL
jgi:hypothetical protein